MTRNLMVAVSATVFCIACTPPLQEVKDVRLSDLNEQSKAIQTEKENEQMLPPPAPTPDNEPQPVSADWDKQIVRNADISFQVKHASATAKAVADAVKISGGYVSAATERQLEDQIKHEMSIRVPREKFDELLFTLSGLADSLLEKNISSEDLTAEFIDTRARIAAKEKMREQYYHFLKQAKNVEEALKVQQEIGGLQEQIEAATGRVNYIRHQSALSSIHLQFFQSTNLQVIKPNQPGFWRQLVLAASGGLELIQRLLIGLVSIWPLWMAVSIITLLVKRHRLSHLKKSTGI